MLAKTVITWTVGQDMRTKNATKCGKSIGLEIKSFRSKKRKAPCRIYLTLTWTTQDKPVFKECLTQSSIFRASGESNFPFSVGTGSVFCFHIHVPGCSDAGLWETVMGERTGILSASSRPAEPVISELEIHRASSNKPRPLSSSHRITAFRVNMLIQISFG